MPAMQPDRWQRIEVLYFAAVEREPAARAAFLSDACHGDDSLRREVESLLEHHELSGPFLEPAAFDRPATDAPDASELLTQPLIGRQIGAYRITELLGMGGMGEVYRAFDTKLAREVAIKVLPSALASDAQRLRLLEQEARLLAALNHPHIAAIYGFEDAGDIRGIVLELVEGPTLADRLSSPPRPSLREALTIGSQIAQAVEAAHKKGIVHGDLKPANIKVTADGIVKVLDFGIARATAVDAAHGDAPQSSSAGTTHTGAILGTPSYMSPEQARGERLDRRTDCWSFACVLFELLGGCPPFDGDMVADTLIRVREGEPDWTKLPASTPRRVRALLTSCLQKDRDHRLDDIGLARTALDAGHISLFGAARTRNVALAVAAVALVAVAVAPRFLGATDARLPRIVNARQVTGAIGIEDHPSWSSDGTLAYESNAAGHWDIWLTSRDGAGTINRTADHQGDDRYPSWSPSGRDLAFWSDRDGGGYYLMPASGGRPELLMASPATGQFFHSAPAWSRNGAEIAAVRYTAAGDRLEHAIEIVSIPMRSSRRIPLPGTEEARLDLSWSPDGRHFAYVDAAEQHSELGRVRVIRIADGVTFDVTDGRTNARRPVWSNDGRHLLYVCNCAGPSDIWRQAIGDDGSPRGSPERVTEGLEARSMNLADDGTLAVARGRWVANVWRVPILAERPATWADAEQITFDEAFIEFAEISPDGRALAYSSDRMGNQDLWVMTLGSEPIQITSDAAHDWGPRWSPDGRRLVFYSHRSGDRELWAMPAAGGPPTRLTYAPGLDATPVFSPRDGGEIAFRSERTGDSELWVLDEGGRERQLTNHPAGEYSPAWSPDGLQIAFTSLRSGQPRIWTVRARGGEPTQLGNTPSTSLTWSPGGEWIYFASADAESGNVWGVSARTRRERPMTNLVGRRGTLVAQAPSTDGRFIYFSWRDDRSDIWVMGLADR
jgi:Tol biopolymer transport system component